MAFNKESNGYIITFAVIMVLVVGTLLAVVAMGLKPMQKENMRNEKMQYILNSALVDVDRAGAGAIFNQYITKRVVIDHEGNIISEKSGEVDPLDKKDAFNIDIIRQYRNKGLKAEDKMFPYYVCEKEGKILYVVPTAGKGLWDLIWGYICIEEDGKTIYGTVFDHKAETPGLGSKIAEDKFEKDFIGKTIAENNKFTSVSVVKPGSDLNNHEVDGIAGATFTGDGVKEMLSRTLQVYYNHFKDKQ